MAGIVRIGRGDGPGEGGVPAHILDGRPRTTLWNEFTDPTGQFFSGLWASEVGAWAVSYREAEFCVILAGRIRLESDDGEVQDFAAGDAFVIPRGFAGIWRTLEPTRKLYAVFEPG